MAAQAQVSIKLDPAQFDLLRSALKNRTMDIQQLVRRDNDLSPADKNTLRAEGLGITDLLRQLG